MQRQSALGHEREYLQKTELRIAELRKVMGEVASIDQDLAATQADLARLEAARAEDPDADAELTRLTSAVGGRAQIVDLATEPGR